jgi:hypothetical protein
VVSLFERFLFSTFWIVGLKPFYFYPYKDAICGVFWRPVGYLYVF